MNEQLYRVGTVRHVLSVAIGKTFTVQKKK